MSGFFRFVKSIPRDKLDRIGLWVITGVGFLGFCSLIYEVEVTGTVKLGQEREQILADRRKATQILKDRDPEAVSKAPRSSYIADLIAERKRQEQEREKSE